MRDGLCSNPKGSCGVQPIPRPWPHHPMPKLAKLLHSMSCHITFVNTKYSHRRLLDFSFETIPNNLPPTMLTLMQLRTNPPCAAPPWLRACPPSWFSRPSSTALLPTFSRWAASSSMVSWASAAREFDVLGVLFWTTNACGFMSYIHFCHLVERDLVLLKGTIAILSGMSNYYLFASSVLRDQMPMISPMDTSTWSSSWRRRTCDYETFQAWYAPQIQKISCFQFQMYETEGAAFTAHVFQMYSLFFLWFQPIAYPHYNGPVAFSVVRLAYSQLLNSGLWMQWMI